LTARPPASARLNCSSSSAARRRAAGARLAEQAADQQEVLDAGEALVDGRVLAGQGDQPADLLGLGDDVVAADQGPALVRLEQGGQMRTGGGLAGPVGAEHGQHVPVRAARSTPSRAVVSPKRLTRPWASMVLSMTLPWLVLGSILDAGADRPVTSG
jgi:hypothetical protein